MPNQFKLKGEKCSKMYKTQHNMAQNHSSISKTICWYWMNYPNTWTRFKLTIFPLNVKVLFIFFSYILQLSSWIFVSTKFSKHCLVVGPWIYWKTSLKVLESTWVLSSLKGGNPGRRSVVTPDEWPSLETSKFCLHFSGYCITTYESLLTLRKVTQWFNYK